MTGYLLDTNLLSELVKKRPEPRVRSRLSEVPPVALHTSAICVTELRYGAARHPSGERLWQRLGEEVLARVQVLPVGQVEAIRAGDLLAVLADRGEPIGIEDVLIGATAMTHGLTVVTRNLRHFDRIEGLEVESWWPSVSPEGGP